MCLPFDDGELVLTNSSIFCSISLHVHCLHVLFYRFLGYRSLTFSCPLFDVGDLFWYLSFTQVFVGSPADGELHRGDVIVAIDNYDATSMVHRQAMDLIKRAGGSLSLRIQT